MKKWLIGSLVGAILLFGWQFLSWTILHLHEAEAKYTSGQDSVLNYLSSALKEDGMYMLPTVPPGTPEKEAMELGKKMDGRPWATVMYKTAYKYDMARPMIRGFLIDLFLVFSLIYILTRGALHEACEFLRGSCIRFGYFFMGTLHPAQLVSNPD